MKDVNEFIQEFTTNFVELFVETFFVSYLSEYSKEDLVKYIKLSENILNKKLKGLSPVNYRLQSFN